jgi:hypothetical protein
MRGLLSRGASAGPVAEFVRVRGQKSHDFCYPVFEDGRDALRKV